MSRTINYKNTWAASGSNIDQQRSDLFWVQLNIPVGLSGSSTGGTNLWEQHVQFAIAKFPFPERSVDATPVKYLQQTNFQIGGDTALSPITIDVRYAFAQRTAELLERWFWFISNPQTGGVALTSKAKADGTFYWLVPNSTNVANIDSTTGTDVMSLGGAYKLEGCFIKGLKPGDADMTASGLVSLNLSLNIDRYYPVKPSDLTITTS